MRAPTESARICPQNVFSSRLAGQPERRAVLAPSLSLCLPVSLFVADVWTGAASWPLVERLPERLSAVRCVHCTMPAAVPPAAQQSRSSLRRPLPLLLPPAACYSLRARMRSLFVRQPAARWAWPSPPRTMMYCTADLMSHNIIGQILCTFPCPPPFPIPLSPP